MTRVGQYRLLERIGEGGMGAVFRGEDTMLQRQVAIKVLRPELSKQQTLVDRFRTEAVALARLNHPNIATVYGLLQQDGQYYMVLEYVDGETLEKRLSRRGRLPWSQAVQVAKDVLAALDHAHRMGVVHRDLKPSNLMINRAGQLKVMDFGIARLAGTSRHTEYGRIVGTPLYMSPEQLRGEEVDGRSDVYSLGVVLYELLTGREAFQADSDYALLMAQLNKMPDPASRFVIDLPDMLDNALTRSLAKDRGERWKSASEFRRALLAIVPEPVTRPTEELPAVVEPKETAFADLPAAAATGEIPVTRLAEPAVPATRLEGERAPVTRLAEEPATSSGRSTPARVGSTRAMRTKVIAGVLAAVVVVAIGSRFVGPSSPVTSAPAPTPAPAVVPTPPPAPAPTPPPAAELGSVAMRPEPAPSPVPTPPGNYGVIVDPNAPKSPKTPKKSSPPTSESPAPAPAPVESAPPPPPPATSSAESGSSAEGATALRAGAAQIGAWLKSRDVAAIERSFTGPERDKLLKVLNDAAIELDKPALASSGGAGSGKPTAEYSGTLRWRTAFGSTRKVPVRIAATFASEADGWRLRSWRFVGSPDLD